MDASTNTNQIKKPLSFKRKAYIGTMSFLMWLCAIITCGLVVFILAYVLFRGLPNISWAFVSTAPSYLSGNIGILPDILNTVYSGGGFLVDGIYARGLLGYTEDNQGWLQYDPEGAKALLAEAGYPDGFTMEISSDNSASSSVLLVLQIIQQNLAEVGITLDIVPYDEASWLDLRQSGEMPSFVATWTADYNDPDNFIYTFFGSEENVVNRSLNYKDTDVIDRVAAARAIIDEDERMAEYAALEEKIVKEDAAWVPLFSRSHFYVLGDRVESFTPHWAGYSAYIYSTFKLAD